VTLRGKREGAGGAPPKGAFGSRAAVERKMLARQSTHAPFARGKRLGGRGGGVRVQWHGNCLSGWEPGAR